MSREWHEEVGELDERWDEFIQLDPTNPFITRRYVEATSHLGVPCRLYVRTPDGELENGLVGYLREGRIERAFEILSLPRRGAWDSLWAPLGEFCQQRRVTRLRVNTFHAPPVAIPTMGIEISRRARREFLLDLKAADWPPRLASNHRRNIAKARRAGLVLEQATSPDACEIHAKLIDASMTRRLQRGEDVSVGSEMTRYQRLLDSGAGVLHQVRHPEGEIVSSMLVLMADRGAYYHSAGTSASGMSSGAAAFLVIELAGLLRARGLEVFNLGGASPGEDGLARFKSGFRPEVVELESAEFFLGSALRKNALAIGRKIRDLTRGAFGTRFDNAATEVTGSAEESRPLQRPGSPLSVVGAS